METKVEEKKILRQLQGARLVQTDFVNNQHTVTIEEGTTMDDVLKPDFWTHVSSRLSPYDEITVRVDDGSWYAKLLVLEPGRNWARVKMLHVWPLTTKDVAQTQASSGFTVKWHGPHCKWIVLRDQDQKMVKEGCSSRREAQNWLDEHLKA